MADSKYSALGAIDVVAADDSWGIADASDLTVSKNVTADQVKDFVLERDATNYYGTTDAGNQGYIPIRHFIRASAAQTLTSGTAAQSIFDSPANGQITLETGVYLFEALIGITGMSSTSGNAQILFAGTGTFGDWLWRSTGIDNSSLQSIVDDDTAMHVTNASAASIVVAGTGTGLRLDLQGTFECSVAGTLIPQIDLVTAAAATIVAGSYFLIERVCASGSVDSLGQWS